MAASIFPQPPRFVSARFGLFPFWENGIAPLECLPVSMKSQFPQQDTMAEYKLELSDSTAQLKCSCCAAGMTSICGFLRRDGDPYAMFYALLHLNRADEFVRLSVSMGNGWHNRNYEDRLALCMDIKSHSGQTIISVEDSSASPQQGFPAFGKWLDREDAREHPALQEFSQLASFITQRDPAISSYLCGKEINLAGRHHGNGSG